MLTSRGSIHNTFFLAVQSYLVTENCSQTILGDLVVLFSAGYGWSQVVWHSGRDKAMIGSRNSPSTELSEWTLPLCNAVLWCNVYWAWVPGNIGCVRSRIFDSTESAMIDDKSVQCLCTSTIFMQYTHCRWCLRETCCQFRHRDHTETSCELDDD